MSLTAETQAGWWTLADASAAWPDAALGAGPETLEVLHRHLMVAHELCVDYGPLVRDEAGEWVPFVEPPTVAEVPWRVRQAQLLQARAQWSAERAGGGDVIGPDGRTVRVWPMDWQVKNLLRPDDGLPVIG